MIYHDLYFKIIIFGEKIFLGNYSAMAFAEREHQWGLPRKPSSGRTCLGEASTSLFSDKSTCQGKSDDFMD